MEKALPSVEPPLPAPASQPAPFFQRLTIPYSRDLLLREAEQESIISPIQEVLQIAHPNEADVSPVMLSPGLPHYEPLFAWNFDETLKPYNFEAHSLQTLQVNKELPPLQLVSPVCPSRKEEELESSLNEVYVSLSDIRLGALFFSFIHLLKVF